MAAQGALKFVPPIDWGLAITIGAGLITAGLTTWATAAFTLRANVRQTVWHEVYNEKKTQMAAMATSVLHFEHQLNSLYNLDSAIKKKEPSDCFNLLFSVACEQWEDPKSDEAQHVMGLFPDFRDLGKDVHGDDDRKRQIATFLRNDILERMSRDSDRLRGAATKLSLICYDPSVPDDLDHKIQEIFNACSRENPPYENVNFENSLTSLAHELGRTLVLFRQDLDETVHSFKKAVATSPAWIDRHKPSS